MHCQKVRGSLPPLTTQPTTPTPTPNTQHPPPYLEPCSLTHALRRPRHPAAGPALPRERGRHLVPPPLGRARAQAAGAQVDGRQSRLASPPHAAQPVVGRGPAAPAALRAGQGSRESVADCLACRESGQLPSNVTVRECDPGGPLGVLRSVVPADNEKGWRPHACPSSGHGPTVWSTPATARRLAANPPTYPPINLPTHPLAHSLAPSPARPSPPPHSPGRGRHGDAL